MCETTLLNQISLEYQKILGRRLVGIYVHGSLAFGCYRRERSDIDFLTVTRDPPAPAEKEALIDALREKGIITERPDDSGAFVLKS